MKKANLKWGELYSPIFVKKRLYIHTHMYTHNTELGNEDMVAFVTGT